MKYQYRIISVFFDNPVRVSIEAVSNGVVRRATYNCVSRSSLLRLRACANAAAQRGAQTLLDIDGWSVYGAV